MVQDSNQNPNLEKNRSELEKIWARSSKDHSPQYGEYVRYWPTDPEYLYLAGFVDNKQFTLEEWKKAFDEWKQPDGGFIITKERFLSLAKYKYGGVVKKPLDAMKLREGWYELTDWHNFCAESILPSVSLKVDNLIQIEQKAKEEGFVIGSKIYIDKASKLRLKQVLDNFPSPMRRRELAVATAYEKLVQEEVERSKAAIVKTTFKRGQKLGDSEKKDLKETLLKSAKIASTNKEEPATISLKDLRKKSIKKDKK